MSGPIEARRDAIYAYAESVKGNGHSPHEQTLLAIGFTVGYDTLFNAATDRLLAAVEGEATRKRGHRYPCVDGNVCGETAHCPPADTTPPGEAVEVEASRADQVEAAAEAMYDVTGEFHADMAARRGEEYGPRPSWAEASTEDRNLYRLRAEVAIIAAQGGGGR